MGTCKEYVEGLGEGVDCLGVGEIIGLTWQTKNRSSYFYPVTVIIVLLKHNKRKFAVSTPFGFQFIHPNRHFTKSSNPETLSQSFAPLVDVVVYNCISPEMATSKKART